MSRKIGLTYHGNEKGGLFENVANSIDYLFGEVAILEVVEDCLNKLFGIIVADLDPNQTRDKIYLSRFNAQDQEQDAFYIQFYPSEKEQRDICHCLCCGIAEGRFLTKEIRFHNPSCSSASKSGGPGYLRDQIYPCLMNLFELMGFRILEAGEDFSKPDDI
jgi:hypothetical protein